MNEPKGYANAQAYGEYQPLELGGHILRIIKVEEAVSSKGNDMIKIYLDTDKTDKQPQYFKKMYDSDTRTDKKWGCIVYQNVLDPQTGETNRGLKTFHECVEKSNESKFKLVWGDKYCDNFKGRLIGGVFRREQYVSTKDVDKDGKPKLKFATKCFSFRSVGAVLKGVPIPKDKLLNGQSNPAAGVVVQPDYNEIPLPDDEDYPF